MIKIEAVVRPERVNIVLESMAEAGCTGFTYTNVSGRGTQEGVEVFTGRGSSTANRVSVPKVLITAVTDKSNQKKVVDAILKSAKTTETGQIGDGKIFISEISDVIRVRTGDTGKKAL
tara:strand:- start:35 stop:388 length:354 start_codon:yes stop_codon:yes gene_type:complete